MGPELPHHADAHDVDHQQVRAVALELQRREIGQHDADEESHEHGDRQRCHARTEDAGGKLLEWKRGRAAHHAREIERELAEQDRAVAEMGAGVHGVLADAHDAGERVELLSLDRCLQARADLLQHLAVILRRLDARRLDDRLGEPDRAHVIQRADAVEVPGDGLLSLERLERVADALVVRLQAGEGPFARRARA